MVQCGSLIQSLLGYRIRTRNYNNKKGWAIKRRPIENKVKIT